MQTQRPAKFTIQIGDVVTGINVVRTTSYTDRLVVRGTVQAPPIVSAKATTFWLENCTALSAKVVFGASRRADVSLKNVRKIERAGVVVYST